MTNALAEAVIATARDQIGKPYKLGAEGPDRFDCSGLMFYAFDENGAAEVIGGGRHRARWYQRWFEEAGLYTPRLELARRGDLVFYGGEGWVTHIALYLGPRRQRAISALINPYGVTRHVYNRITVPVLGFGRVEWPEEEVPE